MTTKTKDERAYQYANEVLCGKRFLAKNELQNAKCIAFCGEKSMNWYKTQKVSFDDAWKFAKNHNDRFSLFVLEIIRRKLSEAITQP